MINTNEYANTIQLYTKKLCIRKLQLFIFFFLNKSMSNNFWLHIYLFQFTVKLYETNKTKMLLRNSWEAEVKQVQVHITKACIYFKC